jgi:hypothetical protein
MDSERKGVVAFCDNVAFGASHNTSDFGLIVVTIGSFGLAPIEEFAIDPRGNRLTRDLHF